MHRFAVLIALALVVFLLACGSSTASPDGGGNDAGTGGGAAGGTGGGGGGVTRDQACADLAAKLCAKQYECFPSTMSRGFGDDQAPCVAFGKAYCLATFGAASVGVPVEQFAACSTTASTATCDTNLFTGISPAACDLRGPKADGQPCASDFECSSGACVVSSGVCGVCTPRVAVNAACTTSQQCPTGSYCASGSMTCKPIVLGGAGASCVIRTECKYGFACSPSGTCTAELTTAGAACSAAGDLCDFSHGLMCSDTTSKCAAIGVANVGGQCGYDADAGVQVLCKSSDCAGGALGTCVAGARVGEACDESANLYCMSGLSCLNKVCGFSPVPACN